MCTKHLYHRDMSEKNSGEKVVSEGNSAPKELLVTDIPRRDVMQTKKIMAVEMLKRGHSYRETAAKVNISTATVHALKVGMKDGTIDQDIVNAADAIAGVRVSKLAVVADQAVDQISASLPEANARDAATALRELHAVYRLESGQSTSNIAIEGVLTHAMQGLGLDDAVTSPTSRDTNERLRRLKTVETVDAEMQK